MARYDLTPFRGIFPAAMTFFDAQGNLDEQATLDHWRRLARLPIDGLVIAGTSGEFISLSMEERHRLFEIAVTEFKGKLPIVAGTGHASTKYTIEMSQRAQDIGADAFIVILPYYSRPPMSAVMEHYRVLRRHTDRPIMLYNNPTNTACPALTPGQIADLVDEDVVHMVKSTMESVVPVHDLLYLVGDRMRIFYGSFLSAFEALAVGANGWVSGILNVATAEAIDMFHAIADRNDLPAARAIWQRMLSIVHLWTWNELGEAADIPLYRGIFKLWGRYGGYSRPPFVPLTDKQMEKLAERLSATGWMRHEGDAP
jgi:4-hydroxy-tetrahydrodipicolinate synthase